MNSFIKRIERIKEALEHRQLLGVTLVYADGSRRSMGVLEAVEAVSSEGDVTDVLSEDTTTRSLLLAVLGPWDFSDLEELEGQ